MRKRHVKFESLGGLVNYGSISGGGGVTDGTRHDGTKEI